MNLTVFVDVAIGLIFVYLTLSLLASEIQELIGTLLQWRAAHLKKSIEILLTGGDNTPEQQRVEAIVDDLYNNPLIQNMNQESKAGIEALLRKLVRRLITIFRVKKETTLANHNSLPSYIASETFATTLLSYLKISQLIRLLTLLNFRKLQCNEIASKIRELFNKKKTSEHREADLAKSFFDSSIADLETRFDIVFNDLEEEKTTLITAVVRVENAVNIFVREVEDYFGRYAPSFNGIISDFKILRESIFFEKTRSNNHEKLLNRLTPDLIQVVKILDEGIESYIKEESLGNGESKLNKLFKDIEKETAAVREGLPPKLAKSLCALSQRAKIKVENTEQELFQFKKEIEVWFDRSMERSSGVYKRNAKGVAFLIGLLLALSINVDTFHIIARLSTDRTLQDAIAQNAAIIAKCPQPSEQKTSPSGKPSTSQPAEQEDAQPYLDCVRNAVDKEIPLPIGWGKANTDQQFKESKGWLYPPLKYLFGWIITGLAITMGAPFWFELIGKFINVRNAGKRPEAATEQSKD